MVKNLRMEFNRSDLSVKRRHKHNNKVRFLVFALSFLLLVAVASLRLSYFRVAKVEVSGALSIAPESLASIAKGEMGGNYFVLVPKDNIVFYPKDQIAAALTSEFPYLEEVKVNVGLDRTLRIEIKEKTEHALWCKEGECYSMDHEGLLFGPKIGPVPEGEVLFSGVFSGNPLGKKFIELPGLVKFREEIKTLGIEPTHITVYDESSATMQTLAGTSIKFAPQDTEGPKLLEYIKLFLDNAKETTNKNFEDFEYIDARSGNKIFYKLK